MIVALLALLALPAADAARPEGAFEVVAVRAAADAAGGPLDAKLAAQVGRRMSFTPRVSWYDGRRCETASVRPAAEAVTLSDRNLSDLAAGPTERRLALSLVIDCGGRALSEITPVLMVDPRVLVMRTADGRAWVILEKPLAPDRALAVERALARLGHDPGPVDGVIDAASRRALARFAASRGAAYAFQASPLTEALAAELVP